MPLYDFIDAETGAIVELIRPVGKRDEPVILRRRNVPTRIGVVCGGTPEATMEETLKKAYHKVEQEQGSRFRTGLPTKTIKKALNK